MNGRANIAAVACHVFCCRARLEDCGRSCGRAVHNVVAAVAAVRKKVVAAVAASGGGFCDGADRTHWSAAHPENAIDKLVRLVFVLVIVITCLGPLLLFVLVCLSVLRRRRPVAMFVQAHAFALAEGDGQRPLCMVPRAQRPLSQVFKMPRSLVLQPGLSAVPLGSRTSRGVLGHPVRACLRPASEGIEGEGPGLCRGAAEGEFA